MWCCLKHSMDIVSHPVDTATISGNLLLLLLSYSVLKNSNLTMKYVIFFQFLLVIKNIYARKL